MFHICCMTEILKIINFMRQFCMRYACILYGSEVILVNHTLVFHEKMGSWSIGYFICFKCLFSGIFCFLEVNCCHQPDEYCKCLVDLSWALESPDFDSTAKALLLPSVNMGHGTKDVNARMLADFSKETDFSSKQHWLLDDVFSLSTIQIWSPL